MSDRAAPGRLSKLIRMGVGALWMTEEGVRKAIQDLSLPRDATAFVMAQVDKRKTEILKLIRHEIQRAFQSVDIVQLAKNLFRDHELEIEARIRLRPRSKK